MKRVTFLLSIIVTCLAASLHAMAGQLPMPQSQAGAADTLTARHPEYLPTLKKGETAPEFSAKDVAGKSVSLSDYRGKYVILDFWASWCGDCRREIPHLKDLYGETANMLIGGVPVDWLAFSFDQDEAAWKSFLAKEKMPWTQVSNLMRTKDDPTFKAYGLHWIPAFIVVDPDGKVAATAITAEGLRNELIAIAESKPTVYAFGDSYVANHLRPASESWHYKMAKQLGLTYRNYGKNGSCIAFDRSHDGRFNFGPGMWERYKIMDRNADYVLIIAGHNDSEKVRNSKDSLKMFRDSLELMLSNVQMHCPKARIAFVTAWNVGTPGFKQVAKVIKKVCKKRGIPVLDNCNEKCIIKVQDADFRKKYFQRYDDTAHLNAAGHDLFLPVGTAWFRDNVLK